MATEDRESSESGRGDMHVETSKDAGWLDGYSLYPELVKILRRRMLSVSFYSTKKKNDKPEWNDISAQRPEFNSYWAQRESLLVDKEGLLCREMVGIRKILDDAGCVAVEFGECCIGDVS